MMPPLAGQLGPGFFAGRRNVGLWFWEVDRLSPVPVKSLQVLDEVWVASEHTRAAVSGGHRRSPCISCRFPSRPPRASLPTDRSSSACLTIGSCSSWHSTSSASANARIHGGSSRRIDRRSSTTIGATLIVKTINGLRRAEDLERLRFAAFDTRRHPRPDEYLSRDQHAALMAQCDAYVSLHRSEGFGLTMAEAMSLGKPVIATGYSGNMEFMDESVASLVPYTLCEVGPGHHPYPADARWADPDLARAGELMRHVFEHARGRVRDGPSSCRADPRGLVDRCDRRRGLPQQVDALRARSDVRATWREFFMRGWRPLMLGRVHRNYDFDWLPTAPQSMCRCRRSSTTHCVAPGRDGVVLLQIPTRAEPTQSSTGSASRSRPVFDRSSVATWCSTGTTTPSSTSRSRRSRPIAERLGPTSPGCVSAGTTRPMSQASGSRLSACATHDCGRRPPDTGR